MLYKQKVFLLTALAAIPMVASTSPFSIVIDGGSTGSRLHVFEFVEDTATLGTECVRHGSSKAWTPLSAFARTTAQYDTSLNASYVAGHLLPLFEYAAEIIPQQYWNTTVVKYGATAGMRLIDEDEQEAVYDAVYEGLTTSNRFLFSSMRREDVATLGGDLEGFYGAVAVNYLRGVIDSRMHMKGNESHIFGQDKDDWHSLQYDGPLGALDMGGASAQIVYLPEISSTCSSEHALRGDMLDKVDFQDSCKNVHLESEKQLSESDFFSTSYLAYGVDQFRERLWDTLLDDEVRAREADPQSCSTGFILNPCAFRGYKTEWKGHVLVGTGNADECMAHVQRHIPHHEEVAPRGEHGMGERVTLNNSAYENTDRRVGGVDHPPLRGKFYGMSLYFFTLDCLRELSAHKGLDMSWPTPSIEELTDALDGLCSRDWHSDLAQIQHSSHEFTRAEVLPHRCIEAVYLVTLLRDGFGFKPKSRDITFTFHVDSNEVDWSLGMALAINAQNVVDLHGSKEGFCDNETNSNESAVMSPKSILSDRECVKLSDADDPSNSTERYLEATSSSPTCPAFCATHAT